MLPEGPNDDLPGGRVLRRAVSWVVLVFAALVAAAAVVLLVVDTDVTVTGHGTLEPAVIRQVRTLEAGSVLDVLARTGDTVVPGTPLVRPS